MNTTQDQPLSLMKRGELPENTHRGRISVVSSIDGSLVHSIGDVQAPAYVRSTAKPVQAIASLLDGLAEAYGFERKHLALMAASHRGSRDQLATLEQILKLTGVTENQLAVGPTLPVGRQERDEWIAEGGKPRKLFHTCAGKHLGVLAWSKLSGWPLEDYYHPDHPAQRELLRRIKLWAGVEESDNIVIGKDGCGFPVASMPLWRLAYIYGQLASPEIARDQEGANAAKAVTDAMNAYPELVEGKYRLASILLSDPNVIAKSGAHGVFAIGLRKEKLGISIAVTDGTEVAWPYIAIAVLEKIGGLSEDTMKRLRSTFKAEFLNDAKEIAGRWDPVFEW
jgi:L-asparaginase II